MVAVGEYLRVGEKMRAKFPGTCPYCGDGFQRREEIRRVRTEWGHPACAIAADNQDRVNSGDTFRSRAPQQWRLGKGPGSVRSSRAG